MIYQIGELMRLVEVPSIEYEVFAKIKVSLYSNPITKFGPLSCDYLPSEKRMIIWFNDLLYIPDYVEGIPLFWLAIKDLTPASLEVGALKDKLKQKHGKKYPGR